VFKGFDWIGRLLFENGNLCVMGFYSVRIHRIDLID
jgi:hypothetical protein